MAAFRERLQIRLRYNLFKLVVRVLLLVNQAAQQAHREGRSAAVGQALVRHDRLQTRL